jgi:5-(carboxyamino)imidazole ribonucleotide synthase
MTTLGIIGGGQLGKMIAIAAQQFGLNTLILTDSSDSPATLVSNNSLFGDYNNQALLQQFCDRIDFATCEFENIPLTTANFIAQNKKVFPSPAVLQIAQNRLLEKDFINSLNIATTKYQAIANYTQLQQAYADFGNSILKTATMGYDGKGQVVIKSPADCFVAWQQLGNCSPLILEQFCPFDCEISVIVARSTTGEIVAYEPLQNTHRNGILHLSQYPANISASICNKAQDLAIKIAKNIDLVGVLAVEFFVCGEELLVNELAPRPHNSGHFSLDACLTSQFEQLIRAITGFKLGSVKFHSSGYMQNLIDQDDISEFMHNQYAKIHIYGKKQAKPGRKMGHVNILKTPL